MKVQLSSVHKKRSSDVKSITTNQYTSSYTIKYLLLIIMIIKLFNHIQRRHVAITIKVRFKYTFQRLE